jgi:hypothetical protein
VYQSNESNCTFVSNFLLHYPTKILYHTKQESQLEIRTKQNAAKAHYLKFASRKHFLARAEKMKMQRVPPCENSKDHPPSKVQHN